MPGRSRFETRIVLAGAAASALLARADKLTVLAAFERSFYLREDTGALVCLGMASLAPGPLMALCSPWFAPGVQPVPGMAARHTGGRWIIGECAVDNAGAPVWLPEAFAEPSFPALRASLAAVARLLPGRIPEDGLAPLLPRLLAGNGRPEPGARTSGPAAEEALRREAWKGFRHLRAWLGQDGPDQGDHCKAGAAALLGLGPGLTPSGDDALGGVMLALHALRLYDRLDRLAGIIAALAPEATNAISRAHLEAAMGGQGAKPLHDAIRELMTGGTGLERSMEHLGRIGHSSGWDAFTGIVLALRACVPGA